MMRSRFSLLVGAALFWSACATIFLGACATSAHAQAQAETAADAQIMNIQTVQADALTAWLVQEDSPLVQLEWAWRHPPAPSASGLGFLTMALLEDRDTADGAPLRQALDGLGAQWHGRSTPAGARLSLRMLAHNKDKVWALLVDALAEPQIAPAALSRAKARAQRRREQNAQTPHALARQLWRRAAFPSHPFGAPLYGTQAGMDAVPPREIAAHHRRLFAQRNSVLGAVGALTPTELEAWLAALAARLPQGANQPPPAPWPLDWQRGGQRLQLERAGPQTFVWFGLPGAARSDEHYYALQLLNLVLGSGMSGRLMQEIREKRGLAYNASSFIQPLAQGSLWLGALASDNRSARTAYALVQSEMARLAREGLSEAELAAARRQFLGRFMIALRSGEAVAEQLMFLQLYSRPKDFLARLPARLAQVTQAELKRAAQTYLNPEQLFAVAIGMSPDFLSPLSAAAPQARQSPLSAAAPQARQSPLSAAAPQARQDETLP